MTGRSEIDELIESHDIEMVRLLWVGNDGVARGQAISARRLDAALDHGISFAKVFQSLTSADQIADDGPFGIADECVLVPDPETFRVLPYADRAAVALCDAINLDGTDWSADPRSRLEAYLDDVEAGGYAPEVAFESEFYLCNEAEGDLIPVDDHPDKSDAGMQSTHDIALEIVDALEAQRIRFDSYYPEGGPGQIEIVTGHAPGKIAADQQVLYRQTVAATAMNAGLVATFLPKPFPDEDGSGCHINLSLWDPDGDSNHFAPDSPTGPYDLSRTARWFVGGVLDHAAALTALTAPRVTSYGRISESSWAGAYACWGKGNREAAVRIPGSSPDQRAGSARIEFKTADNTANPYIALLGLLAAGMDGIDRELDPGPPIQEDPAKLTAAEREGRGIDRLPRSLGESLAALEHDDVLVDALGESLHEAYLATKYHQWHRFTGTEHPTEFDVENLVRSF